MALRLARKVLSCWVYFTFASLIRAAMALALAPPPYFETWSRKCVVQLFGHGVPERLGCSCDAFHVPRTVRISVPVGMQPGRQIIDSFRGECMFDGQDAGANDSSFRAGFGLGDNQMLRRQRR